MSSLIESYHPWLVFDKFSFFHLFKTKMGQLLNTSLFWWLKTICFFSIFLYSCLHQLFKWFYSYEIWLSSNFNSIDHISWMWTREIETNCCHISLCVCDLLLLALNCWASSSSMFHSINRPSIMYWPERHSRNQNFHRTHAHSYELWAFDFD